MATALAGAAKAAGVKATAGGVAKVSFVGALGHGLGLGTGLGLGLGIAVIGPLVVLGLIGAAAIARRQGLERNGVFVMNPRPTDVRR